jgi:molybdopterin/thiamine biosynthesis adenylyltransferase
MDNQIDSEYSERYKRHILIKNIGGQGQKKLVQAKVLLVGLGGIGSTVLQHLAAAGIGKIGLVDQDTVALSNLQRQTIYTYEDIGKKKVRVASNFIKRLNKNVETTEYSLFLTKNNSTKIIREYDLVLDGTDNVEARELINKQCVNQGKPLIFGGVSGWEGLVSLFSYKNSACFECIFTRSEKNPPFFDCNSEGVLGVTTSLVGTLMVAETIKLICGTGQLLTNKLLICDVLTGVTEIFNIKKNERCDTCQRANSL